MQCNAMQCNVMQCNAMRCNAMQCNAMQCNAMQCNAMQYEFPRALQPGNAIESPVAAPSAVHFCSVLFLFVVLRGETRSEIGVVGSFRDPCVCALLCLGPQLAATAASAACADALDRADDDGDAVAAAAAADARLSSRRRHHRDVVVAPKSHHSCSDEVSRCLFRDGVSYNDLLSEQRTVTAPGSELLRSLSLSLSLSLSFSLSRSL